MPKPKKGPRLGGSPAHQRLMLSNLATALFEHGRITTTETRARLLRPVAEKLITKAKRGDLHNRREVLKTVRDKSVVHTLFTEIAPTFAERPGGYTRITKIGPRKGDNAPMAVIELVTEAYSPKAPSTKKTQAAAAPAPRRAAVVEPRPSPRTPRPRPLPRSTRLLPPSTRPPPRSTRPRLPPSTRLGSGPRSTQAAAEAADGVGRGRVHRPDPRSATQARHPAGVAGLRASGGRRAVAQPRPGRGRWLTHRWRHAPPEAQTGRGPRRRRGCGQRRRWRRGAGSPRRRPR